MTIFCLHFQFEQTRNENNVGSCMYLCTLFMNLRRRCLHSILKHRNNFICISLFYITIHALQ